MNIDLARPSGRRFDQLRKITIIPKYLKNAEGSCFVQFGDTHVICSASVETHLPVWIRDSNRGWITAEYGMIPRSTHSRMDREAARGKQSGRTQEIQRLIGRSLRAIVSLEEMREIQIRIDCDVIQADGGTRTAAISGAYVALYEAIRYCQEHDIIKSNPIIDSVAAVSCGIVNQRAVLDLDYSEDSAAEADSNFVLTGMNEIVEIQGTAEYRPFSHDTFKELIDLAQKGIKIITQIQLEALKVEKHKI